MAVILVGRGEAEENRRKTEHRGFQLPAVIQPRWRLSKEHLTVANPLAFLIGEDDVIARNVALGRDTVSALGPIRGMTEGGMK